VPELALDDDQRHALAGHLATAHAESSPGMDTSSQRVAAALSRMRERERLRSRAGGRSHLVQGGGASTHGGDACLQARAMAGIRRI